MVRRPAFLITIDTEGDNLWASPRRVTTENSHYLPRFQQLCESFGLKPVYLTNYEMARCPVFVELGRRILRERSGEVGMHLHAWNSPPEYALTDDDLTAKPFLIEYPAEVIRAKVAAMTRLLEDTFDCKMTSHRAGRWAFNGLYARALIEQGYEVDCSVTPGISWRFVRSGSDYRNAPSAPYCLDPGDSSLLEVPMTILPNPLPPAVNALRGKLGERSVMRRVFNRLLPSHAWLRPNGRNRESLLRVFREAVAEGREHIEMMLHSSELMPGGSPTFRSADSIEILYGDLKALFALAKESCDARTLTEFARDYAAARSTATNQIRTAAV